MPIHNTAYVFSQMAFFEEGLGAKGALERFLSRVHSSVVSKSFSRNVHSYDRFRSPLQYKKKELMLHRYEVNAIISMKKKLATAFV